MCIQRRTRKRHKSLRAESSSSVNSQNEKKFISLLSASSPSFFHFALDIRFSFSFQTSSTLLIRFLNFSFVCLNNSIIDDHQIKRWKHPPISTDDYSGDDKRNFRNNRHHVREDLLVFDYFPCLSIDSSTPHPSSPLLLTRQNFNHTRPPGLHWKITDKKSHKVHIIMHASGVDHILLRSDPGKGVSLGRT